MPNYLVVLTFNISISDSIRSVNKFESPATYVYKKQPIKFAVSFYLDIHVVNNRERIATIGCIYYKIDVTTNLNQ